MFLTIEATRELIENYTDSTIFSDNDILEIIDCLNGQELTESVILEVLENIRQMEV
jgi:hypothetical protein